MESQLSLVDDGLEFSVDSELVESNRCGKGIVRIGKLELEASDLKSSKENGTLLGVKNRGIWRIKDDEDGNIENYMCVFLIQII